jgi:hypothetical protein
VRVPVIHHHLANRDEFLSQIRDRLEQAQMYYKEQYNCKHREVEFIVNDWVWLCLLNRPVASMTTQGRSKLGPRFYGLFQIMQRVRDVTYKLDLPTGANLHPVFHVSLLKPYRGAQLPPPSEAGVLPQNTDECTPSRRR